tara:strand:- start:4744 stop:5466 length:723 start_codon:yes stop_codon:yes gene_type:complete
MRALLANANGNQGQQNGLGFQQDASASKLQDLLENLRKIQRQNRAAANPLQDSASNELLQLNPAVGGALRGDLAASANHGDPVTMDSLTANPAFAAIKTAIERSFDSARSRAFEDTASGGALTGALGGIESGRAGASAQGFGELAVGEAERRERMRQSAIQNALAGGSLFNNEFGVASSVKQAASQGEGDVLNSMIGLRAGDNLLQANQVAAQASQEAEKKGGAGSAAGSIAGAVIGKGK